MSRPEEQLACAIARHHFGPIVGEVVRLLLLQPGGTVSTLVTDTNQFFTKHYEDTTTRRNGGAPISPAPPPAERPRLIRDSLTVLVQHDLVYATQQQHSSHSSNKQIISFDYYVSIDKLMCRSRIPLYIGFARQRFGSIGDLALRTLFQRGRLTSHMIFKLALNSALPPLSLSVSDAEACLTDMARCGLLHWSCRRFQRNKRKANNTAHRNGSASENKPVIVGQKRRLSLDDMNVQNNVVDSDDSNDDQDSDSDDDLGEGQIYIGRGETRKKVGAPTRDNDTDVWTVSYWHLNREFRNECCVKVAQMRVMSQSDFDTLDNDRGDANGSSNSRSTGEIACAILRVGLQLALEQEDCIHPSEDFETTDIGIDDIQRVLEEKDETLSGSSFLEAVQLLLEQSPVFVLPIPEHAPSKLRFIPGRLIAEARQRTLEELIATRYQPAGRRVFQALAIEGGMEEKMLADKCMMHVKVARALVYKLYEDNLVNLQEVSRSSNDQQRSSNWYYLWTVNLLSAMRNVVQVMYKTSCNLFLRLDSLDQQAQKQHGAKSVTTIGTSSATSKSGGAGQNSAGGGLSVGSESGEDRLRTKVEEERKHVMAQRMVLVGNILRMDQSIMVMRDFGPLTASYFPSKYTMIDGPVGLVRKRR